MSVIATVISDTEPMNNGELDARFGTDTLVDSSQSPSDSTAAAGQTQRTQTHLAKIQGVGAHLVNNRWMKKLSLRII